MARSKKKQTKLQRLEQQARRRADQIAQLVEIKAASLTCPVEFSIELSERADHDIEEAEIALRWQRLGLEVWEPVSSNSAKQLVAILRALVGENERRRRTLCELRVQLEALSETAPHDHVEPFQQYADRVLEVLVNASVSGDMLAELDDQPATD
jgi:hypothetical protein